MKVRECECGEARAESARYAHPRDEDNPGPRFCQARSCWLCARRRADPLREWLARTVAGLELPDDRTRWSFVTIAQEYDPKQHCEVSPEGLRDRLRSLQRGVSAWVREGICKDFIHAAFVGYELAGTGHVHAHLLVAAHFLSREWIDRTHVEAGGRDVHVWIEEAQEDTAKEVAKYVAKICSPLDEEALAGEARWLLNPMLAAAWEVGSYGLRSHERYGALRQVPMPEGGVVPADPEDGATPCTGCGRTGCWSWALRPVRSFVRECHAKGARAFAGSVQFERRKGWVDPWKTKFHGAA